MLARTPWVKPVTVAKAKPRRMNATRRARLIDNVTAILKTGEPTAFAFEASCRHGIRSGLCMEGWPWAEADTMAAEIVAAALRLIGAKRPTWLQGQPEYCQPGILALARSRCVRCAKPLPEGHVKFCSDLCGKAHRQDISSRMDREQKRAQAAVYRAAWSAKQEKRTCEECGTRYQPRKPAQRFCSRECSNRHNSAFSSWHK